MNSSEDTDLSIEFDFAQETMRRQIIKYPHSAKQIALQLLKEFKKQRQQQYQLEQKYNQLLASYIDVNDAYLAALKLMKHLSSKNSHTT